MSFFSRIFRNRSARKKSKAQNYDYLPLFFWDKSLSNMAKIIMCLVCGGNANREKTMNRAIEYYTTFDAEKYIDIFANVYNTL